MDALRQGQEPPPPEPTAAAVASAMMRDPDVFRGTLEMSMCMALPEEVLSRPGFMDKVKVAARDRVWKTPGPDRAALLELVGAPPVAQIVATPSSHLPAPRDR